MADNVGTIEEGWHTLSDGLEVYTKTWKTPGPPAALLLFIHGFSDHCDRYPTFFPAIVSRGIQCYSFDQRGWGRSVHKPAQKGLTGPTTMVLDDITALLRSILPISTAEKIPLFLMGHSMGGGEILYYMVHGPADVRAQIRGYIAEAPWIALHPTTQPNAMTVAAGRLVAKLVPKRHMLQKLDAQWVSRDKEVCKSYEEDILCHNTGTLEGLAGMLDRAHGLNTGAVVPSEGSLWIGHGDEDRVTSFEASKKFVERVPLQDKQFRAYPGWYHQLHSEPGDDKFIFINEVADWILERATSDPQDAKSKL